MGAVGKGLTVLQKVLFGSSFFCAFVLGKVMHAWSVSKALLVGTGPQDPDTASLDNLWIAWFSHGGRLASCWRGCGCPLVGRRGVLGFVGPPPLPPALADSESPLGPSSVATKFQHSGDCIVS